MDPTLERGEIIDAARVQRHLARPPVGDIYCVLSGFYVVEGRDCVRCPDYAGGVCQADQPDEYWEDLCLYGQKST